MPRFVTSLACKVCVALSLLLSSAAHVSAASVTINVNKQLDYTFSAEPRLFDVAQSINPTADWYWPGASVFSPHATASTLQTRDQLIITLQKRLGYWQRREHADYVMLLERLIAYVQAMPLADHIDTPLDPIAAGTKAEYNRRFSAGQYVLMVPPQRPTTIAVWGAVVPQDMTLIPAGAAADYRALLAPGREAHNSIVYLVQPNRAVQQAGIAYWNRQQLEPLPGAQLIVPFSRKVLRSDTADVNAQLLILAKHRVL